MGGMADAFVRRYRGEEAVTYLHPALKPILGPTKGVLIFQEQVLRLATEVAGLSWAQADHLRRGMSHFGHDEIAAMQEQFTAGCTRPAPQGPGMTQIQANKLWDQIVPFAGYGFNQGHATAYADVSYRCAFLKTHHPAEFMAARLQNFGGFHHPAVYMAEAIRLGISVHPPHVNYSAVKFTLVEGPALYMGLGQVRDLARQRRPRHRGHAAAGRLRRSTRSALKSRSSAEGGGAPDPLRRSRRAGRARQPAGGGRAAAPARRRQPAGVRFRTANRAPETLSQRWAWEQELLGLPVSSLSDPLALARDALPPYTPLPRGRHGSRQERCRGRRKIARLDRRPEFPPD